MKRSENERPTVCLTCGRVRADGDLGWEAFKIGDATLHLCGRHAGAFAAGVEWADLSHRRPGTERLSCI